MKTKDFLRTVNGKLIAVLIFLLPAGFRVFGGSVLFSDDFSTIGGGPGTNWTAATQGYPDVVNQIISDGSRTVLDMKSSNLSPSQERGIRTSTGISIASATNGLHLDLRFQPRAGGNSSLTFTVNGASAYARIYTQDWAPNRVSTDGGGPGGSFNSSSGNNIYSYTSYYHLALDIGDGSLTVAVKSDDLTSTLWTYTSGNVGLSDFGSSITLALTQVTGAGIVESYIDSVTVSSTNMYEDAGNWVVQSVPDSWAVHFVTNQTRTLVSMFVSGGGGTYPDYVAAMRTNAPKGLGDAFDPGPNLTDVATYQYLATQGYPTVAWAPPYLTDSTSIWSNVGTLTNMDAAGVYSSIQFGEWGYHFHHADPKPYGAYDGYPVQETSRSNCYAFLKSAYLQQTADFRHGRANAMTGHSHYEAYQAEWGCLMGGIEVGENIAFTQSKIAFTRGASRQWCIPWSIQMSPWFSGYTTQWQNLDSGHSLSLYNRMLSHGWFAGAAWLTPEASYSIIFNNGLPANGINSWGVALAQLYAFINAHDRGTPYTPVAIVLDHYAGYNAYEHKAWGTLAFTAADHEIDDLFCTQLFPQSDFIHYTPFPSNPEKPYLRPTPYGELYDVLLSSVSGSTLKDYPVVLLAGDITFDASFVAALQGSVSNGTKVLMLPRHQAALGGNFNTLTNAGYVEVMSATTNSTTGRSAAIPDSRLSEIARSCSPIIVSGSPIQYSINRNSAGWVVELIHNSGVTKQPSTAAVTDTSDVAVVYLKPVLPVTGAKRWGIDASGNASDTDLAYTNHATALPVTVGPGQCVYIQFLVPPTGFDAWITMIMNGLTNYNDCATGDGYPNLLKYATGSSPTNSDNVAALSSFHSSSGVADLRFNRNPNASDVSIIVEYKNDLMTDLTWRGLATNRHGLWSGSATISEESSSAPVGVSVKVDMSDSTNIFLRLHVTRP